MRNCVPRGHFDENKSLLKQSWKFIKNVMEKYCDMRKGAIKLEAYADVLNRVIECLDCKELPEIMPKLINYLLELEIMNRIIDKIKKLMNLEWTGSLNELERALGVENTER